MQSDFGGRQPPSPAATGTAFEHHCPSTSRARSRSGPQARFTPRLMAKKRSARLSGCPEYTGLNCFSFRVKYRARNKNRTGCKIAATSRTMQSCLAGALGMPWPFTKPPSPSIRRVNPSAPAVRVEKCRFACWRWRGWSNLACPFWPGFQFHLPRSWRPRQGAYSCKKSPEKRSRITDRITPDRDVIQPVIQKKLRAAPGVTAPPEAAPARIFATRNCEIDERTLTNETRAVNPAL